MAGYDGFSMSNNARAAYDSGKRPLSQIKAGDLATAGWHSTLTFAKWLARNGKWQPSEWHHTSKKFNTTDFYDPAELVEWWSELTAAEQEGLMQQFRKPAPQQESTHRVAGTYIEWSGSRRHPKPIKREFTGTLCGDWIQIDGGGRKKATGNHITFKRTA